MTERIEFRYKWWALLGVSLLAFTSYLDVTIVNTALPFIQAAFEISVLRLQWVASIFTIILSMTMIATGKLADLWGKKRVFYWGVIFFAIAAFGAGISSSFEMLVAFRGLQALGASTVLVVSASLLTDVFPEKERVRAIGIYGGVTGFGLMIGPFLGGILVSLLGWRWVFWVNLPLIAIGLLGCSFSLRGLSHERHRIKVDWAGLCLLIFGLGTLMYGIVGGAQADWTSKVAWGSLGTGLVALIALVVFDEQRTTPLLDLPIFKKPLIVLAALSCSLAGVASTVFMFFDPLYLRNLRDLPPFLIGVMVAVIPAAQAIISFMFNRLVRRFGTMNLLFYSVIAAVCASILHRFIQEQTPLELLIVPFFLLGINWGLSNAASITAINEVIAPKKISAAIGTIATIWNLVGSLLLAFSTAVFHGIKAHSSFLSAFHGAIDLIIVFSVLVFLAAIATRWRLRLS